MKGALRMKEYVIVRKPDVLDWDKIPAAPIDQVGWNQPAEGIEAKAQLCYDDKALYVKLTTKEKHIKAQYTGELDFPNNDSCLEIYLCPMDGDNRYFNIEVNPNGLLLQGLGRSFWDLIREKTISPALGIKNRPTSLSFRLLLTRQSQRSVAHDRIPEMTADSNKDARTP